MDIPGTRYDGEELIFMTREDVGGDWASKSIYAEQEQINQDPISDAVYTRNDIIYQNYGVSVREYRLPVGEMLNKVRQEVSAPTGDFHAVVSNAGVGIDCANNALIWNLHEDQTSHINLSKSWWDQQMAEGFTISDRIFFATGDLLTLDDDATFVLMFNKTIASEYKLPDLYSMIELILRSRVCDLAYYYSWGGSAGSVISALNPTSNKSISSSAAAMKRSTNSAIKKAVEKIEKNYP